MRRQNIYATVKVNGKIVATLYGGFGDDLTPRPGGRRPARSARPERRPRSWRKTRAERIAKVLGGTIEKAPTRSQRRNGRRVRMSRRIIRAGNWTMPGRR